MIGPIELKKAVGQVQADAYKEGSKQLVARSFAGVCGKQKNTDQPQLKNRNDKENIGDAQIHKARNVTITCNALSQTLAISLSPCR
jgi:hypothetical protein